MVAKSMALALAAFAASSALATASHATNYYMKYSGTVASGADYDNIFGGSLNTGKGKSSNLAGDAFTEVFTVTGLGTGSSPHDPIERASITIYRGSGDTDPYTFTMTADQSGVQGHVGTVNYGSTKRYETAATGTVAMVSTKSQDYIKDVASNEVCVSGTCTTYDLSGGIADWKGGNTDYPTQLADSWNLSSKSGANVDYGSVFSITQQMGWNCPQQLEEICLTVTSATPEPAAWAFMILGVALTGGLLRHSRRARTLSAA